MEEGCENRSVALAFEGAGRGRFQERAGLAIASTGVLPSFASALGRLTPRTGLWLTALTSHR